MRILLCLTLALAVFAANAEPRVLMKTSIGDVVLELDRENAPATVSNFIGYVERGDYDGRSFIGSFPAS
ncbi:MAG: peptidylprolyl isomerase [Gammaproteobacteria bacterium]|nr:peptidylprolyl isomerase [Gammaproteobacteria bacterium]